MTGTRDEPAAYTVKWDEAACPTTVPESFVDEQRLMDLTVQPEMSTADGATYGVVQNLHGDVVGLVDTQGNPVERYQYDVYGQRSFEEADASSGCTDEWFAASPCYSAYGNPRGYTGQPVSNVTGLIDLRNRQYDPRLRIFMSRDPMGFPSGPPRS